VEARKLSSSTRGHGCSSRGWQRNMASVWIMEARTQLRSPRHAGSIYILSSWANWKPCGGSKMTLLFLFTSGSPAKVYRIEGQRWLPCSDEHIRGHIARDDHTVRLRANCWKLGRRCN